MVIIVAAKTRQYSDASSHHWAFQSNTGYSADGEFPTELKLAPIIVKEAYACYKGVISVKKPCEMYLYREHGNNLDFYYYFKSLKA